MLCSWGPANWNSSNTALLLLPTSAASFSFRFCWVLTRFHAFLSYIASLQSGQTGQRERALVGWWLEISESGKWMMDILIGVICILGSCKPIPRHWSRIENLHINPQQRQCDALHRLWLYLMNSSTIWQVWWLSEGLWNTFLKGIINYLVRPAFSALVNFQFSRPSGILQRLSLADEEENVSGNENWLPI